jgi:uncharacterized membrane protein (UPF0182 family)
MVLYKQFYAEQFNVDPEMIDIEIVYINSGINAQQAAYNLMESKIALLKITGGIIQDFNK